MQAASDLRGAEFKVWILLHDVKKRWGVSSDKLAKGWGMPRRTVRTALVGLINKRYVCLKTGLYLGVTKKSYALERCLDASSSCFIKSSKNT